MGAWTGVLALCMARDSSSASARFKCEFSVLFQAFLLRWQRSVAASGDTPQRRRRGRHGPQRRQQAGLRSPGRRPRARALPAPEPALPGRRRGPFRARTRTLRRRSARARGALFRPRPPRRWAIRSHGRRRRRPRARSAGAPDRRARPQPRAELRRERALVESEAADRVHEREAVRAGSRCGGRSRATSGTAGESFA